MANRSLLAHALGWLARGGIREAAVVVPGELAEQGRAAAAAAPADLDVGWLEQSPDESLAETLDGFLEGEPFVLHLADSVAKRGLRSLTGDSAGRGGEALLLVEDAHQADLAEVVELHAVGGGGSTRVRTPRATMAGVAILNADALDVCDLPDGPAERLLEALLDRVEGGAGTVRTCHAGEWWRFTGGADALLEGNRFALEGRRPAYDNAQVVDSTIQGALVAHPQARIESSVVRGPAIVGARAELRNAYVGPYTSIGDDVVVEGAEIEHSVILPGACISHLGARLEASVIGPNSKVFRDFRLPRAFRLTLGEGAEVSLT